MYIVLLHKLLTIFTCEVDAKTIYTVTFIRMHEYVFHMEYSQCLFSLK